MTRFIVVALCLLCTVNLAVAHGDDDHAHDEAPAVAARATSAPQLEITTVDMELVAIAAERNLTIFLDRQATTEPVDGASIQLTADGVPAGTAKPAGSGKYEVAAPWADEPGVKQLVFAVTVDGATTEMAGAMDIAAAEAAPESKTATWGELITNARTWLFAGVAALFGFVLAFAFRPATLAATFDESASDVDASTSAPRKSTLPSTLALILAATAFLHLQPSAARAHEGEDHAHENTPGAVQTVGATPRRMPDGEVVLPKSTQRLLHVRTIIATRQATRQSRVLIGTVVPDPSSFGHVQAPMEGRIELTGRGVSNVGQRVEPGEVLAYLSPSIPIADLGTMQQLTAEVAGKLKISEQKLARLERIAGVVAQKDIDDTRAELDALREQQRVLASKDIERMPLKAPVSGIISVANVRAGQVVTTRETLFEIVDPHRLWIEAISGVEHGAPHIEAAHAVDPDGHSINLSYLGRAPSLRQQTQPLQFKVEETHEGLIIGSAVKVYVQQGEPIDGIVLPDSAVVRGDNGLPRVWAKESPQRFRALPVRVAPLDGARVVVLGGVEAGTRIVVEGAELINQVR